MKLLYFAWLRAKIGTAEETVDVPAGITTVVRVAVNQDYVPGDHPVRPDDEVALFPPVTGG